MVLPCQNTRWKGTHGPSCFFLSSFLWRGGKGERRMNGKKDRTDRPALAAFIFYFLHPWEAKPKDVTSPPQLWTAALLQEPMWKGLVQATVSFPLPVPIPPLVFLIPSVLLPQLHPSKRCIWHQRQNKFNSLGQKAMVNNLLTLLAWMLTSGNISPLISLPSKSNQRIWGGLFSKFCKRSFYYRSTSYPTPHLRLQLPNELTEAPWRRR